MRDNAPSPQCNLKMPLSSRRGLSTIYEGGADKKRDLWISDSLSDTSARVMRWALFLGLFTVMACSQSQSPERFIGRSEQELLKAEGSPNAIEPFPPEAKVKGQFLKYEVGDYESDTQTITSFQRLPKGRDEERLSYWLHREDLGPFRKERERDLNVLIFPVSGVRLILASSKGPVMKIIYEAKYDL